MGPNAPILPPGGAFGPKLYLGQIGSLPEPFPGSGIWISLPRPEARYEWSINMVRKVLEATLIAGTLLLAACNTVSGAGKDVSSAGKAVSNAAEGAK